VRFREIKHLNANNDDIEIIWSRIKNAIKKASAKTVRKHLDQILTRHARIHYNDENWLKKIG